MPGTHLHEKVNVTLFARLPTDHRPEHAHIGRAVSFGERKDCLTLVADIIER